MNFNHNFVKIVDSEKKALRIINNDIVNTAEVALGPAKTDSRILELLLAPLITK